MRIPSEQSSFGEKASGRHGKVPLRIRKHNITRPIPSVGLSVVWHMARMVDPYLHKPRKPRFFHDGINCKEGTLL